MRRCIWRGWRRLGGINRRRGRLSLNRCTCIGDMGICRDGPAMFPLAVVSFTDSNDCYFQDCDYSHLSPVIHRLWMAKHHRQNTSSSSHIRVTSLLFIYGIPPRASPKHNG